MDSLVRNNGPNSGITVYRPNMRNELSWVQIWLVMARNAWGARELIWQFFKRDFTALYKKSFLGLTWVLVMPLMGVISWVFLQKAGMLRPGDVGVPYSIYVLVGTAIWGLFVGLCNTTSQTLSVGKELIMQVNYPHEALLFKQIAGQVARFLIGFVLVLTLVLLFGVRLSWGTLLLPAVALPLFLLSAAIGLFLSMFAAIALDISYGLPLALSLLMYTTPVIYSTTNKPTYVQHLNRWNPLTHLVCSCRDVILFGRLYDNTGFALSAAFAALAFMVVWRLFYVSEQQIVERMI